MRSVILSKRIERRLRLSLLAGLLVTASLASVARADTLIEYYRKVLVADPRLAIAAANTDIANAQRNQLRGQLMPRISVQAGLSRIWRESREALLARSEEYDGVRSSLQLQQPILNVPLFKSFRAADASLRQAQLEEQARQSAVRLDVVDRYLDAVFKAEAAALALEEERAAGGQLAQVRALRERQLAKITDLLAMQASTDLLRSARIRAEAAQRIALDHLAVLAGETPEGLLGMAPGRALPAFEQDIVLWEQRALQRNPELLALQQAVVRAERDLEGRRSLRLPQITLQGNALESNLGFDDTQQTKVRTSGVSISATLPLFAGGGVSAAIGEARARLRTASLQLDAGERRIRSEARAAYSQLQGLAAEAEATTRAVESADRSVEGAERGYALGVITISEVLDARRTAYSARLTAAEARYEYLRRWAQLADRAAALDEAELARLSVLLDTPR